MQGFAEGQATDLPDDRLVLYYAMEGAAASPKQHDFAVGTAGFLMTEAEPANYNGHSGGLRWIARQPKGLKIDLEERYCVNTRW